MTIEAQGQTIFVRCNSPENDVMVVEPSGTGVRIALLPDPNGFIGSALEPEDMCPPIPLVVVDRAEALALGHMLIDMASRIAPGDE